MTELLFVLAAVAVVVVVLTGVQRVLAIRTEIRESRNRPYFDAVRALRELQTNEVVHVCARCAHPELGHYITASGEDRCASTGGDSGQCDCELLERDKEKAGLLEMLRFLQPDGPIVATALEDMPELPDWQNPKDKPAEPADL